MNSVQGKVVVITGAGAGIGRQLTYELANRGARLVLADAGDVGLASTAAVAQAFGAEVYSTALDLSDRSAVQTWAAEVAGQFGVVHQLYTASGTSGSAHSVIEADWGAYETTLAANLFATIYVTKAFLPHLIASGDGHVVTVSSVHGLLAHPGLSDYCTGEFAIRGFTESLRCDMLAADLPVQVSIVHPGGVKDSVAAGTPSGTTRGRESTPLRLPAARDARTIIDGVEAGRPRIIVGHDAKIADHLARLLPSGYAEAGARHERRHVGKD